MEIIEDTIEKTWVRYCRYGIDKGILMADNEGDILESPEISIKINYPSQYISSLFDETLVNLYVKKIYSTIIIEELNSTYGDMLFDNQGVNQIDWLIEKLQLNQTTKGASIGLLSPTILRDKRRLPCLTTITAKIRDNKLNLYASFRSQNIKNSYANFIALTNLQEFISQKINISVGFLHIFVVSPHIYKNDMKLLLKQINYES
jgi:thymidylate synthase